MVIWQFWRDYQNVIVTFLLIDILLASILIMQLDLRTALEYVLIVNTLWFAVLLVEWRGRVRSSSSFTRCCTKPEYYRAWIPFKPIGRAVYCDNCGDVIMTEGPIMGWIFENILPHFWYGQVQVDDEPVEVEVVNAET